jgi:methanogenic corrinoid protein MtbC1
MIIEKFIDALLTIDKISARKLILDNLRKDDPFEIIVNMVVPAMEQIGVGWEKGDVALSQVYMSGRIVEDIIDEVLPPADPKRKDQPSMAIAVLNDFHMLGKRIIYSKIRASGYSLMDFGHMTVDELVEKVIAENIKIILISTLMLSSALQVKIFKKKLAARDYHLKIMVGGAPFRFDDQLAKEVGADYTAININEILKIIDNIVGVST